MKPTPLSSWESTIVPVIEGILPKEPYLPCVSMAGRAILAGYHRDMADTNYGNSAMEEIINSNFTHDDIDSQQMACWNKKEKTDQIQPSRHMRYTDKSQCVTETYLDLISNAKYRIDISKLRASSHNQEIERGRYTRPKVNPENRLCPLRYVVDNEIHFC